MPNIFWFQLLKSEDLLLFLSYMIVNSVCLRFGLLFRHNKQFKDTIYFLSFTDFIILEDIGCGAVDLSKI